MDNNYQKSLEELARVLGDYLLSRHMMLTTAESCTGGLMAQVVTAVSGSSQWFERGFVTYSNEAKQDMLGVSGQNILLFGAVSKTVALEMAQGALSHSIADCSIAITGIAGPTGGDENKPVGTVWVAWADRYGHSRAQLGTFAGDRQTAIMALQGLMVS